MQNDVEELEGNCLCPKCDKIYNGNPETDQICFDCWFKEHKEGFSNEISKATSGAGGFPYYQMPNTIQPLSNADLLLYASNFPRDRDVWWSVLHNSATPAYNGISVVKGFQAYHIHHNGWSDIGYHLIWTPNGQAYLGRNWVYQGAHAYAQGNRGSLGICMVGNFSGAGFPTKEQINSYAYFCSAVRKTNDITKYSGHRWADWHRTSCPGVNVSLDMIQQWSWKDGHEPPPPQPKKEVDSSMYVKLEEVSSEVIDGKTWFVYDAAEGFADVSTYDASCWLIIKNSTKQTGKVQVHTVPFTGVPIEERTFNIGGREKEDSRLALNMAGIRATGGFATTVKSLTKITGGLSLIPSKK